MPGQKNKICFHILISPTTRISFLLRLYQKVSGDGRLLHAVEGALGRRAGLKIKQGLHQALAFVRVAASHHEVLLLGVVVLGLLRALCVVNGRGGDADVEVAGVAGVDDVVGVDGLLRKEGGGGGGGCQKVIWGEGLENEITQMGFGTRTWN